MPKPMRILVIDDEIDTLELIDLTLRTAGFSVRTVDNGEDAVEILRQDSFDAILLDVMMPEMSGFDVLRAIDENTEQLPPVIFLTASKRSSDQETGENLGAAGYLVKPVTRGQLLDVLHQALSQETDPDASN
jgi:DNA-binding response OmpR family regulator